MDDLLLAFNAGSSSVKIGLFALRDGRAERRGRGHIDLRAHAPMLTFGSDGETLETRLGAGRDAIEDALSETFDSLGKTFDLGRLAVAGHRIVHGGDRFAGPVRLDDAAVAAIDALTPLAPLHQPQGLRLIRAVGALRPRLLQTASFDTAFHATMGETVRRFAIPRDLHDAGVKRYGFHGLSYTFIARELARRAPEIARKKIVVFHLGSGVSLCGIDGGISRDTSMGFSTLDGVPMATRPGALDPGVLLHLLGPIGRPLAEVEDMLYRRSGLLGLSGISADSRDLLASDRPEAKEAIAIFVHRIAGEAARIAATLGGIDAVVFTAGIGEHRPAIRAGIAERLGFLGLALDADANAANAVRIGAAESRVAAFVIPTDEEQVIADEAAGLLVASG